MSNHPLSTCTLTYSIYWVSQLKRLCKLFVPKQNVSNVTYFVTFLIFFGGHKFCLGAFDIFLNIFFFVDLIVYETPWNIDDLSPVRDGKLNRAFEYER